MPEYRIVYTKIPTAYNDRRLAFVTANTAQGATEKARIAVERRTGTPASDYVWEAPTEVTDTDTDDVRLCGRAE